LFCLLRTARWTSRDYLNYDGDLMDELNDAKKWTEAVDQAITALTELSEVMQKSMKDLEDSVATFEGEMELLSKEMMEVCEVQSKLDSVIRYVADSDNVAEFEVSG